MAIRGVDGLGTRSFTHSIIVMRRTSFEQGGFIPNTRDPRLGGESFSKIIMFEFIVTAICETVAAVETLGFVSRNCLTEQANKAGARKKESLHV